MPCQTANSQRAGLPPTLNPNPNSILKSEPLMPHIQEISTLGNTPHPDPAPKTTSMIPPVPADQHTEPSVKPPIPDCSVTPKVLKKIECTCSSGSSFQLKSIKKNLKRIIFVEKKHNSLK